jgi:serine/threonine protein kinase
MDSSPEETQLDFIRLAVSQSFLPSDSSADLAREATILGKTVANLALEKGMMDNVQVDILTTLLHSKETVPGYEILEVLGRGGMGVVYRARQVNLDRPVALKMIAAQQLSQPGMLTRFEQEAVTVGKLRHPNIVAAYDLGNAEGRLYFAMELVEGENLEALIQREGSLSEAETWALARQALAGLSHADRAGIVHRDVKPQNLLLVEPPEGSDLPPGIPMLKITDFGLALLTAKPETLASLTMEHSTLGSPHYMAPEQISGSKVDRRADIYALGATIYHMLSGQPPFPGGSVQHVLAKKLERPRPVLHKEFPNISQETSLLVASMMAKAPEDRPSEYSELIGLVDSQTGFQSLRLSSHAIQRMSG